MSRDFSALNFMTARSNKSTKEVRTGQQVFEEIILNTERNLAKKLGNSERLEKWRKVKFFGATRCEWQGALKLFAVHHFGPLYDVHAGAQQTLGPVKEFVLVSIRHLGVNEILLRNQFGVIAAAAAAGDLEFFRKINLAERSFYQGEQRGADLPYLMLCYWFSGLLWLMSEKPGWVAFCEYTGRKDITKAAYRSARRRLGLNRYKDRIGRSPVLEYDSVRRIYKYRSKWSRMEPDLTT